MKRDRLGGSLRASKKLADSRKAVKMFSHKDHNALNKTFHIFFPAFFDEEEEYMDIVTGTYHCRRLDGQRMGKKYCVRIDDTRLVGQQRVDNTALVKYGKLASAFHEAAFRLDSTNLEEDAKKTAMRFKKEINAVKLQEDINNLRLQYFGQMDKDPKVYPTISPVISSMKTVTATEAWAVPVDENGMPVWKDAFRCQFELSDEKLTQLVEILDNPKYWEKGDQYLEVLFKYKGTTPQQAGLKAKFEGLEKGTRIPHNPATADSWVANCDKLKEMSRTEEEILAKNPSLSMSTDVETAIAEFEKYIAVQPLLVFNLDMDSKVVKDSAKELLELPIVKEAEDIQEQLLRMVEAQDTNVVPEDKESIASGEDTISEASAKAAGATSLRELEKAADGDLSSIGNEGTEMTANDISNI